MKIILQYDENRKVEISTIAENIHEIMEEIKRALIAYGFHPDTVRDGFKEMAEEVNE